MTCEKFTTRDGITAILCSRKKRPKRCQFCEKPAGFECDGLKPKRKSGHCDKRMCEAHRTNIGRQELGDTLDTMDLCPECATPSAQQELF